MRTALVTGASRGVGLGVAISLAESGLKVFATGRSIAVAQLPASITRVPCDHADHEQTAAVFAQIRAQAETLDVLVNAAWGGYERMVENGVFTWNLPFWEQPQHRWVSMMDAGVRAAFVCSAMAARIMVPQRSGLIINISYWAARKHMGNAIYGIAKAATDKLTADAAVELLPHQVAVVSLYPGLVRTEAVMQAARGGWLDISNSESPEFCGRVIAALADDRCVVQKSGRALVAAELARQFGITDVDGRQPLPLTLETS